MTQINKDEVVSTLNKILEKELAGVVCYTHYSFMVYGYARIPIVSWMRDQASENLAHAHEAGELITSLGGHPSLGIGQLLETHKHDIGDILRESLVAEQDSLKLYCKLLDQVAGKDVRLEEYARKMVYKEENHLSEVNKMLRKPGDLEAFKSHS